MIKNKNKIKENYYNFSSDEVLTYFDIDKKKGISKKDLKYKLNKFGRNEIKIKNDITFMSLFLDQIKSFLNLLLIFLSIFSFVVWIYSKNIEHIIDAIIIFLIFIFNSLVGAYQNYSSKKIADTLSKFLDNNALVLRDGIKQEINAKNLFPGDIIFLEGGDKVPADCYLINSQNLKVDESILTGESVSVMKESKKILGEVSLAERLNMIYMNTFIVSGRAKAIVVNTGSTTQMGKIADELQNKKKKISFIAEIDEVSKKISKIAILLIILVSFVLYLKGIDTISIFLIASALIIGSIPEGLPAIVVFLLSRSTSRLSKKKILVKDIGLLETLGSIDILCTDKTGTLTQNNMSLKKLYLGNKEINNFSEANKKSSEFLVKVCSLVNGVNVVKGELEGEAEDIALINFLDENNIDWLKIKSESKVKLFEPFTSENKFSYCILENNLKLIKGAPDVLIENCNKVLVNNKLINLDSKLKEKILLDMKKFADEALRLIGFSYWSGKNKVFVGFCGLYDKPKEGIEKTISKLYDSKIEIKMITGDNKLTAIAIAKETGFRNIRAIEWKEIKDLDSKDFKKAVLSHNIFARMSPQFKEKILEVLQKNGHRVAITGDGVNDSIALKQSDVGIVMGSGSDIAKESGDMILINNDFNSIPDAILEGRGIFYNIRKVVNYLLTANLAEVLTIFVASFFGLVPFTAIQILWVNFVTDVFPSMALGVDKYPKNLMKKYPNGKNEKILNLNIILLTLFISIKKVIIIFSLFLIAYHFSGKNLIFAQTISFTWLVLSHFVRIAAIRFDEHSRLFMNKYLMSSLLLVFVMQVIIIYTPLRSIFNIVELSLMWWIIILTFVIIGVIFAKFISMLVHFIERKVA